MNIHPSMRGYFAYYLHKEMQKNNDVYVILIDLGYGMFDAIRDEFPDRVIITGASEQASIDLACGLAMSGKIPIVYSITPFLIYRAFESIRNYIDREELNVKLVGSGRDKDYAHDGFSHDASDVPGFMDQFVNIAEYYPNSMERMESLVKEMIEVERPMFISLRR